MCKREISLPLQDNFNLIQPLLFTTEKKKIIYQNFLKFIGSWNFYYDLWSLFVMSLTLSGMELVPIFKLNLH